MSDLEVEDISHGAVGRLGKRQMAWAVNVWLWLAFVWLGAVVLLAAAAPILPIPDPARTDPCTGLAEQLARGGQVGITSACPAPTLDSRIGAYPSFLHPLGTDEVGRDIFSRLVWGGRIVLAVALGAVATGGLLGSLLGLVAGYFRGWIERAIMSLVDVMLSFPALLLIIGIVAFAGQSLINVCIGIALVAVPAFARIARSSALTVAEREFVKAAKVMGYSTPRILFNDVAPNVLPTVRSYALLFTAIAIVAEGSLAFLGLSVPPPTPSWGSMISGGKGFLATAPHISLIPSLVMFVSILALNVAAEGTRLELAGRESVL